MKERWYSACARYLILVEQRKHVRDAQECVYLLKSTSHLAAFKKALKLAKQEETRYKNNKGEWVAWKLKEIVSLDELPNEPLDGIQVAYRFYDPNKAEKKITINTKLNPAKFIPQDRMVSRRVLNENLKAADKRQKASRVK